MNLLQQIANNSKISKPAIYSIESFVLSDQEKKFFSENRPVGFILFGRNIVDKNQVKKLVANLKEIVGSEVLILIDQEGGRVARLKPPFWPKYPSAQYFTNLYKNNKDFARKKLLENFQNIANDLAEIGINVDCAPVLDSLQPHTHKIIGDRAYGENAKQIIDLAQQVCNGLLSKKIYPVIKHIPGHGRAKSDSHLELPIVNDSLSDLRKVDFEVFKAFSQQKFAMTAHILYTAIDQKNCATISKKCIDLIRNEIGFKNILMSDDIAMRALRGSFGAKTQAIINAGCDLILYCSGKINEMLEINDNLPNISDDLRAKFAN